MRLLLFAFFLFSSLCLQGQMDAYGKQFLGHSHNDYEQKYPLTTALNYGFTSIEIDVYLHQGKILVAHDPEELETKPTIQELYLDTLFSKSWNYEQFILLVDIKEYTPDFLDLLEQVFLPHKKHLKSIHDEGTKPVQIILSGDVPKKELLFTEEYPYFFIDGREADLEKDVVCERIVMVSAKFSDLTLWQGRTRATHERIRFVVAFIDEVKKSGRMIRFWDTPDTEESWKLLLPLGVDIIGVDDLKSLYDFTIRY